MYLREFFSSGCPAAWLISNREDEATLTMFFKAVQKCCPKAVINTLMTDDGELSNIRGYILCITTGKHIHTLNVTFFTTQTLLVLMDALLCIQMWYPSCVDGMWTSIPLSISDNTIMHVLQTGKSIIHLHFVSTVGHGRRS